VEVLHDVRTRSRVRVRIPLATISAVIVMTACGDAPRETPADTALASPSSADSVMPQDSVGVPRDTLDSASAFADVPDVRVVLAADSAAGDSIFNRRGTCFTCHGQYGTGMPSLGADLRDATWLHSDGSFRAILRTIRDGVAVPKASPIGMPSFQGRLSEAELRHVAAYVFSLSHPGSVVLDTTTVPLDTLSPFTLPAAVSPPR
jgi:mono/diheme cytochrome c family protein